MWRERRSRHPEEFGARFFEDRQRGKTKHDRERMSFPKTNRPTNIEEDETEKPLGANPTYSVVRFRRFDKVIFPAQSETIE
jgi:hypothetical protein